MCEHIDLCVWACIVSLRVCVRVCAHTQMCTTRSSVRNRRVARPFTVHSCPGLDTSCSDCNPDKHLTRVCGDGCPKVQGQAERPLVWVLGRALDGTSPACGVVLGRDWLCHQSRHPGLGAQPLPLLSSHSGKICPHGSKQELTSNLCWDVRARNGQPSPLLPVPLKTWWLTSKKSRGTSGEREAHFQDAYAW